MDIKLIYFIIIIFANMVGSISGMGGGVIIKPIMDTIQAHPVAAISFYSSVAVFTMSLVSTFKQVMNGVKIDSIFSLFISLGAVIGGIIGNSVFDYALLYFSNESSVQLMQIILTICMLIYVMIFTKDTMRTFAFKSKVVYVLIGFFLGFLATLLGIGGGPLNVTLLMLCFAMPVKEATVYSIVIIFFSQLSKLLTIGFTTGYGIFDLTILYAVIPAAIIGGFVGAKLSGILSERKVMIIYKIVVIFVIGINIFNGLQLLSS